ncbi:MAG: GDSL-type esterase/lipase family protein [Opitutaceae bacterium]|nr:GDSL-type esterase/lipase family protein [Opitutaceae bacterium]
MTFTLSRLVRFALIFTAAIAALPAAEAPPLLALKDGDRVIFLGDGLIEGEQYHGWIELMLTTRFAGREVTFRNLGWSGDTPAGDSRFGLSLLQAGREPADEGGAQLAKQIEEAKPTVVFIAYGMANSFDGAAGLAKFRADYTCLLDVIGDKAPGARLVLVSPIAHENLGAPWPDPASHNAQLAAYARAVGEIAAARGAHHVALFDLTSGRRAPLTHNGIQPTGPGYRVLAELIEDRLFGGAPGAWRTSPQTEPLRQAILRKNEWFFHRSRPANMAYIFGFRKREQGNNATEVLKFDEFIATEEQRIAQLRALQPARVPEIPMRSGNLVTEFRPQPQPQFEVADGFDVTLWAENPLLHKPIQMNFDARGRLWVASSELYPQIEPGQAASDKIIVLEDTTGAGRADKATVFADGLLIPTGVAPGDGGVYVAQSTELLHFRDTDGDGKADVRRAVLRGFGTEDTHHNLHTLRWAPDGRLQMAQSVYTRTDAETPHGVVRLKAGGIFRLDPRDQKMDILYRGWVNAWGNQFDDFGQSFVTDGAGFQGISWGIPGATYRTLAPARRELQSVSAGAYPKFCGLEIVRSTLFPSDWQGDFVTADFRAHRIVRFKASDQGSGYVTKEMPDVMRTTANSFRPIDLRMGPDGALYIADWSNPIIQHGEVDFRDVRRDKAHGRIWRVAPKGRPALARTDLTKLANRDLLGRLTSPNGYEVEQARQVLAERGSTKVLPDLAAWTATLGADESARLRALWMHQSLDGVPAALGESLLAAKDPRVRAAAIRALPVEGALPALEKLVADEHPRVRVEALRALGRQGTARAAELALGVLERPMDPFLDYALWLTINDLAEPWLAAVKSGAWKIAGREKQLEFGLKAVMAAQASEVLGTLLSTTGIPRDGSGPWIELIGSAGGAPELQTLVEHVMRGQLSETAIGRALTALTEAARLRSAKPAVVLDGLDTLLQSANATHRLGAIHLAGAWKFAAASARLVAIASGAATKEDERRAAFVALREMGGSATVAELKKLAAPASPPAVRREAVLTLASLELPTALPEIIALLQATTGDTEAATLWRALLAIRGVSGRLATELPKTGLPREVARAGLRPAREGTQHQALVPVLLKAAGLSLADVQLSAADMQALAREALAQGDARRGEHIYRRAELACVACHAIGGAGGKIGPDLTSIGASAPPDYLVEALLYPSAKIKEGYHSVMIATKSGEERSGMITRETATEVVLRDATDAEVSIPVKDIARRTSVGSLMPAGLIDDLVPEERLDLIAFLAQLGKPGDFDASKGGVARNWQLYLVVSQNMHIGIEPVTRGDLTLAGWVPVTALANGTLPRQASEIAFPNRGNTRGLFAATQFDATKAGPVKLSLGGEIKGAWLDGVIVPKPSGLVTVNAKAGRNVLVLQIDEAKLPEAVSVRSGEVNFVLGP